MMRWMWDAARGEYIEAPGSGSCRCGDGAWAPVRSAPATDREMRRREERLLVREEAVAARERRAAEREQDLRHLQGGLATAWVCWLLAAGLLAWTCVQMEQRAAARAAAARHE